MSDGGCVLKGGDRTYTNFNSRTLLSHDGRNHDANFRGMGQTATPSKGVRASTRGTDNIFCESIVEQAQLKKPAFNTGTFRLPGEANERGYVAFNPGPGSYSTRINSIGSQYVDVKGTDKHFKGLLTSQGAREKNVYFTRENGGLK